MLFPLRILAKQFLCSLVVFSLLACTGTAPDTDRQRLNDWSVVSLALARESMERYSRTLLNELHDHSASYPSAANARLDSLAQKAAFMVDRFDERASTVQNRLLKGEQGSVEQIRQFEKEALLLRDSLLLCSGNDPALQSSLPDLHLPDAANPDFLNHVSNSEAALILGNLMVRTTESKLVVLRHFSAFCVVDLIYDRYSPVVSPTNPAPRVGEWYKADIFLGTYASLANGSHDVKISVNGEELPVQEGVAHFSRPYTTPGEKRYTVNIRLKDTRTGEVRSYVRDFSLHVLPPEK